MEAVEEEKKAEIIIVRRSGSNHDDEHHGGVWKIAYADFMTAMMAFFLVMWLVNVASDDAKQAVANYFNPIKMMDHQPQKRELEDDPAAVEEPVQQETQTEAANNRNSAAKNTNATFDEDAKILEEPYGALETIALLERQDGYRENDTGSEQGDQRPPAPVSALRDPFAPPHWQEQSDHDEMMDMEPAISEALLDQESVKKEEPREEQETTEADAMTDPAKQATIEDKGETPPEVIEIANTVADDASNLMQKIMEGRDDQEKPQMEVHVQDNTIIIELTDTQNYGMFAVGSAKPESHIVDLLEGLAKIIDKYPGEVVVSGYTDARPYRNTAHYDNWQLSAARAQMAHYMLVRGGLDESRILKVEGYADRCLRNEQDSYAAENRRIAIYLKNITDKKQGKNHES